MSPYQQDVINETLEFDVQAQKGIPSIAAQAVGKGVLGGGREGVMRSEYQGNKRQEPSSITSTIITTRFWSSSSGKAQQANQPNFSATIKLGHKQQQFLGQDIGALSLFWCTEPSTHKHN